MHLHHEIDQKTLLSCICTTIFVKARDEAADFLSLDRDLFNTWWMNIVVLCKVEILWNVYYVHKNWTPKKLEVIWGCIAGWRQNMCCIYRRSRNGIHYRNINQVAYIHGRYVLPMKLERHRGLNVLVLPQSYRW